MDDVDITIIGAGVIGLAAAARLAEPGRSVLVLEKNEKYGMETSSRNSEVIHSGIYYPQGTFKAKFCVLGNRMLYDYCAKNSVRCANTGKIVVAADESELEYINDLKSNGGKNGVTGLEIIPRGRLKALEPEIEGAAGLLVPSTGIIDTHGLMYSLLAEAQRNGATIACKSEVTGLEKKSDGFHVSVNGGYEFRSKTVINCAGLGSDRVASMAGMDIDGVGYRLHYSKGSYFKVSRNFGVKCLIYPVPAKNIQSLGIHLVLDLTGGIRFGPDAVYVKSVDYSVDEGRKGAFFEAVRKYLPSIRREDLSPDMAGVRPKLQPEGGEFRDFVISEESSKGLPGLVNLIGIDSPGLTSALAIAEHVGNLIYKK